MADEPADTKPFEPVAYSDEPPWLVNRDEDEHFGFNDLDHVIDEVREGKTPEPALVRGALFTGLGIVGYVLGKQFDTAWVEPVVNLYAVAAPLALAWWIRRHVTPVKK